MFGISLIKVHFVLPTYQVADDGKQWQQRNQKMKEKRTNELNKKLTKRRQQQIGSDKPHGLSNKK